MSQKRHSDVNSGASSSKRRHLSVVNKENDVIPSNDISLTQTNEAIRSGKIHRIHLINFMCHSNLSIEFHNRVNLLIGCNGSGKSAILTALIIGLGSKARDTKRSSNIKQLIKTGESSADIEITIDNNGPDAYESDIYGNFITICRHITASGSSAYKIKDEYGHIISKKTDDLHKILLYHNIQTDNPVFVLNQDSARTFLKEMEPSKNYQLFLKATQIETIIQKLNQCGLMYNKYKYQVDILKKESDAMEQDVQNLKDKYKHLQSADQIKINIEEYKLEQLWLKVEDQEVIVAELNDIIEKLKFKCEKYQNLIDNKCSVEEEYKIKIHKLHTELQIKTDSLSDENEKLEQLKIAFNNQNEKYLYENNQITKINNNITHFKDQINILENRIAERSEFQLSGIQKMRQENEEKLTILVQEEAEITALIDQQKLDFETVNETKMRYEREFESLKKQRDKCRIQIEHLQRELSTLNSTSKDQISLYGPQMAKVLDEIEKANRQGAFSAMPRGPLGRYIQVHNQKWRGPIEYFLQGLLRIFIVNNSNDRVVLDKIISKFNGLQVTIMQVKFHNKVYDISQNGVTPARDTVLLMDEIKCKDPVVINCLIDRAHIDRILLCENQNVAVHLTSHLENVPKRLLKLILLNPFLDYRPAPLYRTYGLRARKPQFIQVNLTEMKGNLKNEITQNEKQKTDFESKLRDWKSKLQQIYQMVRQNELKMQKHQQSKALNTTKIQEINSIEYPEEGQIDFYKKEKLEIEIKIQELINEVQQKEYNIKELLELKINSEKEFQNQNALINNNDKEINELRRTIDELKFKLNSLLSDAKNWEKKKNELSNNIQERMIELDNANDTVNRNMEIASQKGERIPVNKTFEELESAIKKSQYHLNQICSTQESIEDIKSLLEDKQQIFERNQTFIVTLLQTLEMLKRTRLQRFKFIINLKQHMALRVKYTFDSVLQVKNFVGGIQIDHTTQQLHMSIVPRDNHLKNAVSNTKSLSGGERSYSTIALLLSLWSCVDHAFYFLDEYDVFTDQINREIMTKLLLSEAEKKPHRQYTFLTPQDISFVKASDLVTIHRLAEPKR